jgi:hypothetical protein
MGDINEIIKSKLKEYPDEVAMLAMKAIELSEPNTPESTVAEDLRLAVKHIVRNRGTKG